MVNPTLHQLSKFTLSCIVFFSFIFGTLPLKVLAFDDAAEINHTYLNQENFLDIKSYQFNKLREEEWYESSGGWRLTGGSIGLDLLYSQLEVRLPHSISEETTVIFLAKQQEFYEIKPFRYQVEVEWRPYDLASFSLLGMPEYDKRKADQGASVTLGKRPWNYLRFQKSFQDLYYNEQEITQFWPLNKTITPDDVRGESATLKDAVITNGWPLLDESRGKAIFVLLASGESRDLYAEAHPGLVGARMFVLSDEGSNEAVIFSLTDPIGNGEEITRLVSEGYIVRSRADSGGEEADNNDTTRRDAALAVGAHSISTDYPAQVEEVDYWVEIPGGTPSRCNPITSPVWCTSEAIEDHDP